MSFKAIFIAFLTLLVLSGCDASKRAQRHVRKAISLDPTISVVDTIRDTIRSKRVDTLVSLPYGKPTVITKDGITLMLKPVTPMDVSPTIEVTAETDPIIREIPVERIKYVTNPPTWKDTAKEIALWVLIGLAILLILRRVIDKLFQ